MSDTLTIDEFKNNTGTEDALKDEFARKPISKIINESSKTGVLATPEDFTFP